MAFSDDLLSWYDKNARQLPWRNTKDPYKIWLSEIILQQTRVEQGMPYYYRFTETYPDLKKLAEAEEENVLRLWQGLGYYTRARNLHQAARTMLEKYGGFPTTYDEILALKGIGDYTASAVSSIAFGQPHAVVDGNVYRFLSRYFGIELPVDSTAGKKYFKSLASSLLDQQQPGKFNQAMMEMGALICKPVPDCKACPFVQSCVALKKSLIESLPVKSKTISVKERFFYYLILKSGSNIYIRKREGNDIWKGLYDFPLIETKHFLSHQQLLKTEAWKNLIKSPYKINHISSQYDHHLSHQILRTHFIHIEIKGMNGTAHGIREVPADSLPDFGMPQLIVRYMKECAL